MNCLKVKIALIERIHKIKPYEIGACAEILGVGVESLSPKLHQYALGTTYELIIQDLVYSDSYNHQLAIELDNLKINIED